MLIKHDIERLQISVHYILLLHVLVVVDKLSKQQFDHALWQLLLALLDQFVQVAVCCVFEYEIKVFIILYR